MTGFARETAMGGGSLSADAASPSLSPRLSKAGWLRRSRFLGLAQTGWLSLKRRAREQPPRPLLFRKLRDLF